MSSEDSVVLLGYWSANPVSGGTECKPSGMLGIDWLTVWCEGCLDDPSSEMPLVVFVGMCVYCTTLLRKA